MNIKEHLKHNEKLNHVAAWFYSLLNNFGRGNKRVCCTGAYLNDVRFSVSESSRVVIGNLARLRNCSFSISGRNSKIIIGGGRTVVANSSFCICRYSCAIH